MKHVYFTYLNDQISLNYLSQTTPILLIHQHEYMAHPPHPFPTHTNEKFPSNSFQEVNKTFSIHLYPLRIFLFHGQGEIDILSEFSNSGFTSPPISFKMISPYPNFKRLMPLNQVHQPIKHFPHLHSKHVILFMFLNFSPSIYPHSKMWRKKNGIKKNPIFRKLIMGILPIQSCACNLMQLNYYLCNYLTFEFGDLLVNRIS